jgi:hypothetical protein
MASWASVLKAPQNPAADVAPPTTAEGPKSIAIVDANAIINGLRLEHLASSFVTIPEVLDEIRDKQSRQFLATLPFPIETREPSDESVKAGEENIPVFLRPSPLCMHLVFHFQRLPHARSPTVRSGDR